MKNIIWITYLVSYSLFAEDCSTNSINNLQLLSESKESISFSVDYCYKDKEGEVVMLYAALVNEGKVFAENVQGYYLKDVRGQVTLKMPRPPLRFSAFSTTQVKTFLSTDSINAFYENDFSFDKEWPRISFANYNHKKLESVNNEVIKLIDSGNNKKLNQAKEILDAIVKTRPDFTEAYTELARYFMKTQGFGIKSKGVLLAEQALLSGLEIDSENANVLLLLGYVFTWEQRYDEALQKFKKAESIGTTNTWLYTNWGQMYEHQSMDEQAMEYYEKAARQERKHFSHDRAISMASSYLFDLYIENKKYKEAKKLAANTYEKFPTRRCFKAKEHTVDALYLNNYKQVIGEIELSENLGCRSSYDKLIAIANLRLWDEQSKDNKSDALTYYLKAMNANPEYVDLLVSLSKYDFSSSILKRLKNKRGMEVRNVDEHTALTKAIVEGDHMMVERLLIAGADVDVEISTEKLSTLMLAVLVRDEKKVSVLLKHNVDTNKKSIQGATAVDIARMYQLVDIEKLISSGSEL